MCRSLGIPVAMDWVESWGNYRQQGHLWPVLVLDDGAYTVRRGDTIARKGPEVEGRTIVVEDVEQFPGHIACSSESKSEIVVPVVREGQIVGVLDIDSDCLRTFDAIDASRLEEIVRLLS